MFSNGDYLSETIAHFIGHFDVAIEEMRLRQEYERFSHDAPLPPESLLVSPEPSPFAAPDVPVDFVPETEYTPRYDANGAIFDVRQFRFDPPIIDIPLLPPWTPDPTHIGTRPPNLDDGPNLAPAPPSVVFVAQQHKFLFDNDVVVIGDYDGPISAPIKSGAEISALTAMANAVTYPFTSIELEKNPDGIAPWVKASTQAAQDVQSPTAEGDALAGTWADGQQTQAAPELIDHLPSNWQENDDPVEASSDPIIIDAKTEDTVMTIEAGGNLSVNQATIINAGVSGTITAVAGDAYEMDVIVQVNVLRDEDTVADGFPLAHLSDTSSKAVNVASFVSQTKDAGAEKAEADIEAMPTDWQLSIIEEDLIFFNWIYQYNFTSDNDSLVVTAMGTTTTVSSGGNAGINGVAFSDLGMFYDLILIGGNLYDANYICQTNIIYDNDTVSMLSALSGQQGTVSTGENLLWNQASIENIGPAEWTNAMPGHYSQAMDNLDAGVYSMPGAFGSDANFAGYDNLKVLYVKGNVFDINYVEQVNVISDADQLAFYSQSLDKSANWTVETGGNAAVNVAGIVDYDSNGATWYVEGQSYSEAMLIQANLVEEAGPASGPGQEPLANEVIAFLDDDTPANSTPDIDPIGAPEFGPTTDVMDSVLA
tara:strand:+ start:1350 stop:3302 length:1953 start_codon:yes stop_codon:yes gene_type:complete